MWLFAAAAFAQTCPCVWLGQAAGWEEPQPTCSEHALSPPSYLQDVDIDNDADARAEYSEKVRRLTLTSWLPRRTPGWTSVRADCFSFRGWSLLAEQLAGLYHPPAAFCSSSHIAHALRRPHLPPCHGPAASQIRAFYDFVREWKQQEAEEQRLQRLVAAQAGLPMLALGQPASSERRQLASL